jgi:hypothetical protein
VSVEERSVEGAVVLRFPLERVRPAEPWSEDDESFGSTVFSFATGLPLAAGRRAQAKSGGTLPPAA